MTRSYPQFVHLLGASNFYTLQSLSTRAAAEGQLGNFDDTIRDDLAVHQAAVLNPSAQMYVVMSLIDAATSECVLDRFSSGLEHARAAYNQTRSKSGTPPALTGAAAFALAQCLLAQHEVTKDNRDQGELAEVKNLLEAIDVNAVAHFSGNPDFPAFFDVARARLALAQKDYGAARQITAQLDPLFEKANWDPYEKSLLKQVESSLAALDQRAFR